MMKKTTLFLALAVLCSAGAVAQKKAVDDANRILGGMTPDFEKARTTIKPALTDPESKDVARTWFVAGKTEFGYCDDLTGKRQIGQKVDEAKMYGAVVDGYNYFLKAFPLDSIPNEKGKIKPKYSKDMIGIIANHRNDFNWAGITFYQNRDYKKAFDAWEIFLTLDKKPFMASQKMDALHDTIVGQTRFYQAAAAMQNEDHKGAIASLNEALKAGNDSRDTYRYLIDQYTQVGDSVNLLKALSEASTKFSGKMIEEEQADGSKKMVKDNYFTLVLINTYINSNKMDKAITALDELLKADPTNAEFYNVKGQVLEASGKTDEATAAFKKAVDCNPEYVDGLYNLGRMYYNEAQKIKQESSTLSNAEYAKVTVEKINPKFEAAKQAFEKAYGIDAENPSVRKGLKNVYYQLKDSKYDSIPD